MTVCDEYLKELRDSQTEWWIVTRVAVQQTAAELLERREAERKAKSWDDAPEWAKWRVMEADGTVWYHEKRPTWHKEGYWLNNGRLHFRGNVFRFPQNSLEERPE